MSTVSSKEHLIRAPVSLKRKSEISPTGSVVPPSVVLPYLSVDSVPSDGHQVTLGRHDVTEQRQVPVVDVNAVEVEHRTDLFLHGLPDGFDSQDGEDLADVVRECSGGVDFSFGEDSHEGGSVRLEQPLGHGLELAVVRDHNTLLVVSGGQMHVHLGNGLQT